jgi:hypothetical protein
MTQWLRLIFDDTSERELISSKILPIIMVLAVINDQKDSWLVTPWVEALLWTKTIVVIHVLTSRGAIATPYDLSYLTIYLVAALQWGFLWKSILLVE